MIVEILFYFFLIFGVVQFATFIWDMLTSPKLHNNAVIIYPLLKDDDDLQENLYALSKYSFPIYAVASGNEKAGIITKMSRKIPELELMDKNELIERINTLI